MKTSNYKYIWFLKFEKCTVGILSEHKKWAFIPMLCKLSCLVNTISASTSTIELNIFLPLIKYNKLIWYSWFVVLIFFYQSNPLLHLWSIQYQHANNFMYTWKSLLKFTVKLLRITDIILHPIITIWYIIKIPTRW